MTNVVSIFTKTKKTQSDDEGKRTVPVSPVHLHSTATTESRSESEVDDSDSGDKARDNIQAEGRFDGIAEANAERLKKLKEERAKENQMVLKSYRIK